MSLGHFSKLSLTLGLLSLSLVSCEKPQQKEVHFLDKGNVLYAKGDYEKAKLEYKNAAQLMPLAAEPRYRMGLTFEAEGDLKGAFENFTVSEQQNTHYHPAILKVAQYYIGAQMYDPAKLRIDRVLAEDPMSSEAHALNAALLAREKDLDAATKEAALALQEDPSNVSASAATIGILAAKGDLKAAIVESNRGIGKNPKDLGLLILRANLNERLGDDQGISNAYSEIFKIRPTEDKYRIDLASIFAKKGKLDLAEKALRDGIAALPDDWILKHQLVLFLDEYKNEEAAENEIHNLMAAYPKNDDLYFWLADIYGKHNNSDKAEELLQQIVTRGKDNEPALNAQAYLARIDIAHGSNDLAQNLVNTVLSKNADNASALFVRASLSSKSGYYESAIIDLRKVIRINPKNQEALQLLAEIYLTQRHIDLAIDTMRKLAEINPANMPVQVRLAQMINMSGDAKQALDLINTVTKSAPSYGVGWETSARIAIDAKDWLPAETAIRTLDKIPGQHLTASYLEGQVQEKTGNADPAITKYTEVVNADDGTPLAQYALTSLVNLYHKNNRLDTAVTYLSGLKPDTPLVSTLLGECYIALNKPDLASVSFDKAIALKANFQEPYLDRAKLYLEAHAPDKAIEVLKKGTSAVPGNFHIPLEEATLLTNDGHYPEAIAIYDDMLVRNPSFDAAANNLAEVIADYKSDDATALEKARQAAERFTASTNPLLLDTLAWVYYRQNNLPLALTVMERAMEQGGNVPPQVHYHYAAILQAHGEHKKALEEAKKATIPGPAYPGIEDARNMLKTN